MSIILISKRGGLGSQIEANGHPFKLDYKVSCIHENVQCVVYCFSNMKCGRKQLFTVLCAWHSVVAVCLGFVLVISSASYLVLIKLIKVLLVTDVVNSSIIIYTIK